METQNDFQINAEITPNPNTLKFNVGRTLVETGSLNFPDREKGKGVLLAESLFSIDSVLGVMIGHDFVTVTKRPESGWQTLAAPIIEKLKFLLASGKTLVPGDAASSTAAASDGHAAGGGEIERKIREILDAEIRPAVAMDGGDITFYGYENGVVTLHLQGSCSHCPSSIMTLKMGVENRLKSLIPEIREVVQV
jgi:Fe-S cluster biogenesis protein NfuA